MSIHTDTNHWPFVAAQTVCWSSCPTLWNHHWVYPESPFLDPEEFKQRIVWLYVYRTTREVNVKRFPVSLFNSFFVCFLAFDVCRFCVVIRVFHPRHNGQWPPTSKDFYTRSYPLHYFLILILEEEPVFSLFNVEC